MQRLPVFLLALLFLTVGLAPIGVATTAEEPPASPTIDSSSTEPSDELGCVEEICHDDELTFETATELSDDELAVLVARTMARVQILRGETFDGDVPVEIQSRAAFQESSVANRSADETFNRWNDQVWKALFVVGKDDSSADAISGTVGQAVAGFYQPSENRIVLITADPDAPTVDEQTLFHEFVHALQDQRHDLTSPQFRGETQDEDLAVDGILEGEARYLEYRYQERCETDWQCFDRPSTAGGSGSSNPGVLFTLLQPYANGPAYVHEIIEAEGWDGLDDRFAEPPQTTREIIHRDPFEAGSIDSEQTATDGWDRYPDQGVDGAERVGEASIFVMFWYQAREYGADTIDHTAIGDTSHEYEQYSYVSEPSAGWVADQLIPYQRGDEDGYVWTIEFETTQDTAEFRRAYGAILDAHDATETEDGVYIVDGSFGGAYGVEADDTQVRIVHAPTEAGLFELRPSLEPTALDEGPSLVDDVPGFGIAAALAALFAVAVASRRRR